MSTWALLAGWMLMAAPADFSAPLRARGEKQAASSARLTSDGQQLLLEVEVVDPTPSTSTDDVHSDHVEVWFALEDLKAVGPTRFVTTEAGGLFTVNGGDKPRELDRSIRMLSEEDDAEDRCAASERSARESIGKPPSRRVRAFFGLAHLGLFRDGRPAVLYDRPLYAAAGLAPSLAPGDVSYEVQKTKRGYHLRAVLQPGGLVFVPRTGVETLRARVDVIDAGPPGAPERVRSSHPAPRWGEPSTFHVVKLAQPLKPLLLAGVPELGQQDLEGLPPYFMRVGEEWRGVAADSREPTDTSNRYCLSSASEVLEHVFLQWELGPATPFAGPDTVRIPVRATGADAMRLRGLREASRAGELLLFREEQKPRAAWIAGAMELGFRFEDGTPGAVVKQTGWMMGMPMGGPCGAAEENTLELVRLGESGPTSAEMLSWDACSNVVAHEGQELVDLDGASFSEGSEASWPGYTWEQPGQKLRMKFADDLWVVASWNARDGSGVTVRAEKPEEEP
ncbi:hypothetical protein OV207_05385 [Corallococcus sp. BB11-1]|uniref:hypothetical protein n=1 Tax=Corallococcus sp. BB11-1 TaxID=2996783 RepID=UPI00226E0EF6|nr:hypothetical protein [Corallococcus sp. BB11-1]MCY1030881.1 hypothetical protein [Corallococcus sp. BB11-1]